LIRQGVVRVNGKVVRELGVRADPVKDKIEVRGRRLVRQRPVYVLLHKPRGTVTTCDDPEGRKTVMELISGLSQRLFPVGRLDYHTSGVLVLTNDGEMAQALSHPSSGVARVYRVKVTGKVSAEGLEQLRRGVTLTEGKARAYDVVQLGQTDTATTLSLTLKEGRYHQIHRMVEAIGHRVTRLARTSYAGLTVDELPPGQWRRLTSREIYKLKRDVATPHRARQRARRRAGRQGGESS
jgi:23S rRNA pseudouridine2605 synthase